MDAPVIILQVTSFNTRIHINPLKANTEPSYTLLPTSVGQRFIFPPYKFKLVVTHYQLLRDKYSEALSQQGDIGSLGLSAPNKSGGLICLSVFYSILRSCESPFTRYSNSQFVRTDRADKIPLSCDIGPVLEYTEYALFIKKFLRIIFNADEYFEMHIN